MMGSSSSDKSLFDLLAVAADPDRAKAFLEDRGRMLQLNRQSATDARRATAEAEAARFKAEEADAKLAAHSMVLATSMEQLQAGVAKLEQDRAAHEEAKAKDALAAKIQREAFAAEVKLRTTVNNGREIDLTHREEELAQAARALDVRAATLKAEEAAMAERKAELAHRFTRLRDLVG